MTGTAQILFLLATGHLFTVMSPGPNQALVLATGARDRFSGLMVALGSWPAGAAWAAAGLTGMGEIIRNAPRLELGIRVVCSLYLLWLGVRLIRLSFVNRNIMAGKPLESSPLKLVAMGFVSNITNPKTIAWYASIFTATGAYELTWPWRIVAIVGMPAIGFSWNTILVLMVSSKPVQRVYQRVVHWIDRLSGGVLLLFGLKLLAAK